MCKGRSEGGRGEEMREGGREGRREGGRGEERKEGGREGWKECCMCVCMCV